MNAWKVSATCMLLAFLCIFSSIGYAKLSGSLTIDGQINVQVPYGLFITAVEVADKPAPSNLNTTRSTVTFVQYSTTVDSTIRAAKSGTATSVTYKITVLNNTNLTYSYRKIYYQTKLTGYDGNDNIATADNRNKISVKCSLDSATAEQKKVAPGDTLEFTVTYTVGRSMDGKKDWSTLINYQFGINVDGEREALDVIEKKFLDILNNNTTYLQLIDALDNKYDGYQEWTSNYIGNVKGSSSADSVAVNTLFAGQLQITVGKDNMDATVLIKHENIDWNNYTGDDYVAVHPNGTGNPFYGYGCEMTLYLTIDPLDTAGKYVPVYAVVFTCNRDWEGNKTSDWYRIGSTYAGKANVVTYDGGNGTGSFVTDNWIADAATYEIIAGYNFNVNGQTYRLDPYIQRVSQGVQIEDILIVQDAQAVATLQNLLNDAKRIINDHRFAGVGIELVEEVYYSLGSSGYYTIDGNGNHVVNSELTVAQLSPSIVNLYRVVNDVLAKMEEMNGKN